MIRKFYLLLNNQLYPSIKPSNILQFNFDKWITLLFENNFYSSCSKKRTTPTLSEIIPFNGSGNLWLFIDISSRDVHWWAPVGFSKLVSGNNSGNRQEPPCFWHISLKPKTLHMEVTKSGTMKNDRNVLFGILSLPAEMAAPWTLVSCLCQHCLGGSLQTTHTNSCCYSSVTPPVGAQMNFLTWEDCFFWQWSSKIFFSKLKIVLQRHLPSSK